MSLKVEILSKNSLSVISTTQRNLEGICKQDRHCCMIFDDIRSLRSNRTVNEPKNLLYKNYNLCKMTMNKVK